MARTGRPRTFDRDEAVRKAMLLFWEHGYESTSLTQLKAEMGDLSAASFYAAFTSKEALFKEVVEQYVGSYGQATAPLRDETLDGRTAIELALRGSARMQTDRKHPLGCLLVQSANTCSPENIHIQRLLARERGRTRTAMQKCVERAIRAGDLPQSTDVTALASVFDTFLFGVTPQARDGVSLATLEKAIGIVMRSWDDAAAGIARLH